MLLPDKQHDRKRHGHTRGFTLIEAMISVAISTIVLLMAAAAVRGASQSLRKMETISEENHLLLKGWLVALQDVDFWNSHANPDFPYLAGPMAEDYSIDVGGTDTTDHPWNKRPFRMVTFSPEANPNLLLPNDPRTWYRGGTTVMTPPIARTAPSFEPRFVWTSTSDATVGERIIGTKQSKPWPMYPAGWSPRAMTGDYSAIARALAVGDGSTEYASTVAADASNAANLGVARSTTDYISSLQWYIYSELGHIGAARYLPPGTMNMIYRPNTNRTVANIGNTANFFDWGEVPWTLASGSQLDVTVSFAPEAFLNPQSSDFAAGAVENVVRRNMLLGFPGSGRPMAEMKENNLDDSSSPVNSSRFRNNRGTSNTVYVVDLETVSSRHIVYMSNWNSGDYHPVATFYPGRVFRIGSIFDTESLVDRTILDPSRLLVDDDANANNVHVESQAGTAGHMERRFSMTTQHQPSVATNDDRRLTAFGEGLQMQHRIVRYRANYADTNKITVIVANPQTGARIQLQANVVGTTYTGARQHWGWKSDQTGWTHGDMGDRYAP